MPKLTIDGQPVEVQAGKTIIEAATDLGIEIPHFCWHPKLTTSGNCRMCLVEIEKMPKLGIACMTQAADGMIVYTKSEKSIRAREAVMEFLLINHPLDCPICDEAGECKLQDYAYKFSKGVSRFEEDKVHKPKRYPLGPRVLLDVERCIMCSRCIRFADEIAHQPALTFTQRGDHVVLTTFPDTEFDSPYSMNVIELCPVGALTSLDFRFRSRVWEMSATEGVCVGCSRGCNTDIWVRQNEILRLTPRHNENVNSYWMCDKGRLETFKQVHAKERLSGPQIRRDGQLIEVGWDEAVSRAVSELRGFKKSEIAVLGTPFGTNEDNYIFARFAREVLGTRLIDLIDHSDESDQDDFLLRADKTPNSTGARLVGIKPLDRDHDMTAIVAGIKKGTIKALYVLDEDIATHPLFAPVIQNLQVIIYHTSWKNATSELATIVFSSSTYAEKNGTFTNFDQYIQRIRPAIATLEQERSLEGFSMSRWDTFASHNDRWGNPIKKDARSHWRIIAALSTAMGVPVKFKRADEVFKEISEHLSEFKGLTYAHVGTHGIHLRQSQNYKIVTR